MIYPIRNSESFNYKTKLVGNLPGGSDVELENIKFVVPLKNLSRFIFNLDFLMINTEIELILKWSQQQSVAVVEPIDTPSDLKFNITDCKLYVPVVTLQEKYNNKLLEKLKTGMEKI